MAIWMNEEIFSIFTIRIFPFQYSYSCHKSATFPVHHFVFLSFRKILLLLKILFVFLRESFSLNAFSLKMRFTFYSHLSEMHQCHCHEENKYIIILFGAERRTHVSSLVWGKGGRCWCASLKGSMGLLEVKLYGASSKVQQTPTSATMNYWLTRCLTSSFHHGIIVE